MKMSILLVLAWITSQEEARRIIVHIVYNVYYINKKVGKRDNHAFF